MTRQSSFCPLHSPYTKTTTKKTVLIRNPYKKATKATTKMAKQQEETTNNSQSTTKMAKQEETTNNSQSSLFQSFAPGFYFLPYEEMVLTVQTEEVVPDANEWAESTGLIARQDHALQIAPAPTPSTPKKFVSEPLEIYKRNVSKAAACIWKIVTKKGSQKCILLEASLAVQKASPEKKLQ
jgi:hypothetical protein